MSYSSIKKLEFAVWATMSHVYACGSVSGRFSGDKIGWVVDDLWHDIVAYVMLTLSVPHFY